MKNRLEGLLKFYETDPKDTFTLYGIALEYISLKDFEKAEMFFQKIFEVDTKYIPAYMQYALLKSNLGETEKAKELFIKGISVAKEVGDTHAAAEMEEFLDEL